MFPFLLPVNLRILFALSMLSNIPAGTTGNANSIIGYSKPIITNALENAPAVDSVSLHSWHLVWGPAVITKPGTKAVDNQPVASNSMSIFTDLNNNYVVAIQATNPYCDYDWEVEDANVTLAKSWKDISPAAGKSSGKISTGTFIGLRTLLDSLKDPVTNIGVQTFFSTVAKLTIKFNLIVTGHSLGGALSPALALYLHDQQGTWDPKKYAQIYCMSTAGATPGDGDFATYYNSILQPNTERIWNRLDVVPHAWVAALLDSVKSHDKYKGIYSVTGSSVAGDPVYCPQFKQPCPQPVAFTPMTTPDKIDDAVDGAKTDAFGKNYTHICGSGYPFQMPAESLYINVPPTTSADTLFMEQLGQQHVYVYNQAFNIMPIHTYVRGLVEANPSSIVNTDFKNLQRRAKKPLKFADLLGAIYQKAWAW
ncbi:MAG: lipase family protein [Mucilaginibacter sp.]